MATQQFSPNRTLTAYQIDRIQSRRSPRLISMSQLRTFQPFTRISSTGAFGPHQTFERSAANDRLNSPPNPVLGWSRSIRHEGRTTDLRCRCEVAVRQRREPTFKQPRIRVFWCGAKGGSEPKVQSQKAPLTPVQTRHSRYLHKKSVSVRNANRGFSTLLKLTHRGPNKLRSVGLAGHEDRR